MTNRILDNYKTPDIFYIQILFLPRYEPEDVWVYYA